MTADEYQDFTTTTAVYRPDDRYFYNPMGLCGEVGELLNKVKKMYRLGSNVPNEEQRAIFADELGDIYWYIAQVSRVYGLNLSRVWAMKVFPAVDGRYFKCCLQMASVAGRIADCVDSAYGVTDFVSNTNFDWQIIRLLSVLCFQLQHFVAMIGYTMDEVMAMNIKKLTERKQTNQLKEHK